MGGPYGEKLHSNDLYQLLARLRNREATEPPGAKHEGLLFYPAILAKFCQDSYLRSMSTMNISLPEALKSFVDDQVTAGGYSTSSEYVRELIRKDQDRQRLRDLLLDGAASPQAVTADADYFNQLRARVREAGRR